MMKRVTPFVTHADSILPGAVVTGPRAAVAARLIFDTGAVYTTITPELANEVGYSARDGVRRTRVLTAISSEQGYVLEVSEFAVLGITRHHFPVHVFDLGFDDIDGLVGLNFLRQLNCEVRPVERRILIEQVRAG